MRTGGRYDAAPAVAERDYLPAILNASVYDVAVETPLERAEGLSERLGNELLLKREDLQPIFSFKVRGAYNKMAKLSRETLARGVVAASAGNHAQGVALAAQHLGAPATIVMPTTTPRIKIDAVVARGAKVVLDGDTYEEAADRALALAKERGLTFVHPYDDPDVIAGQGTVAVEILRQCRSPIHSIFVPIGGGGLIGGIAAYVKRLRPEVRVVGVEPRDADAMRQSLAAGRRVTLRQVGLFADGVAVRRVGKEGFGLARRYVDDVLLVSTDELCAAIKDVFDDTRSILEPAGALSVAGAKLYAEQSGLSGATLVAVLSGANMNFDRLRFVSERAELGEHREAIFAATIPERPGSFKTFCRLVGKRQITEFNYRYADTREAHVFVGVEVRGPGESDELLATLARHGIPAIDLSDDELAKLHVRHLVGGRASLADERLLRFEFPDRPGALMRFLESMGQGWNISLFHYRNHGADYGRVLAGIQVPPREKPAFSAFLRRLGYAWTDETENPAYELFLR
jgi:threonine dehydratase